MQVFIYFLALFSVDVLQYRNDFTLRHEDKHIIPNGTPKSVALQSTHCTHTLKQNARKAAYQQENENTHINLYIN